MKDYEFKCSLCKEVSDREDAVDTVDDGLICPECYSDYWDMVENEDRDRRLG